MSKDPTQQSGRFWAKIKQYGEHLEYVEGLESKIAYHQNMIHEAEEEIQRIDGIIAEKEKESCLPT